MLFERLHQLGSRADRLMLYPREMFDPTQTAEANGRNGRLSANARMLIKARDEFGVKLVGIEVQHREGDDSEFSSFFWVFLFFI
jgi:hypothetical protein